MKEDDGFVGPYCDDDGNWWVPRSELGYLDARRLVKGHMDDLDFRLVYVGREMALLDSEHEAGCEEGCPSLRYVSAWHFREDER